MPFQSGKVATRSLGIELLPQPRGPASAGAVVSHAEGHEGLAGGVRETVTLALDADLRQRLGRQLERRGSLCLVGRRGGDVDQDRRRFALVSGRILEQSLHLARQAPADGVELVKRRLIQPARRRPHASGQVFRLDADGVPRLLQDAPRPANRFLASWVEAVLPLGDCLLKGIDITGIVKTLAEAGPVHGRNDRTVVVHPLSTPGTTSAQIIKWVWPTCPVPVPGDQRRITTPPEAEAIGHAAAFAHCQAVFDLAGIVVRVAPVFVPFLGGDPLVGHGIWLGAPNVQVRGVSGRIRVHGIFGRISSHAGSLDGGVDLHPKLLAGRIDLVNRAANELRPTLGLALALEIPKHFGDAVIERWRRHRAHAPVALDFAAGRGVAVDAVDDSIRRHRRRSPQPRAEHVLDFAGMVDHDLAAVLATQAERRQHVQPEVGHGPVVVVGGLANERLAASLVKALVPHVEIGGVVLGRVFLEAEVQDRQTNLDTEGPVESVVPNRDGPHVEARLGAVRHMDREPIPLALASGGGVDCHSLQKFRRASVGVDGRVGRVADVPVGG